ncbi:MAG: DUF2275 domain-containing protein [Deltaproteobacteria bacterium]
MKKCQDIEELLPLYTEGILTDAEKQAVEEHLADCAACRRELACLQKAGQLAANLTPVEEPPWFQQKIMAQVRREADQKSARQKWFYPLRFKIPLQIAATVVIAVLAVYIYRSGDEQVKDILPGAQQPAMEMQKEQAPSEMPRAGEMTVPSRATEKKEAVREGLKQDRQVISGAKIHDRVQKSEAPAGKPDAAFEEDAAGAKGLAESRDKTAGKDRAPQNELKAAKMPMPDQENIAADQTLPARTKRGEAYKMAAPAAPQSMGSSIAAPPQARVSIQADDPHAAASDVEKILARYHAVNISRQPSKTIAAIRADLPGRNWQDVLLKLKEIGQVQEKGEPVDSGDRPISVVIEISGR